MMARKKISAEYAAVIKELLAAGLIDLAGNLLPVPPLPANFVAVRDGVKYCAECNEHPVVPLKKLNGVMRYDACSEQCAFALDLPMPTYRKCRAARFAKRGACMIPGRYYPPAAEGE